MRIITLNDVEYVAFLLARQFLAYEEPIPDFSTMFPNILESCILTPFQKFSGKPLYPAFVKKAAILLYLLIKNNPFQNGNRKIALTTLLTFLNLNNKWLVADDQELYNFTVWVAQSPAGLKKQVVSAIEEFVRRHLVDLNR